MPRYSAAQLTPTKILAQRPRTTITGKRKSVITREEKDKLMRIARRPRKGPFNSIMDPSEYAAGSGTVALSAAVMKSGTYDPWVPQLVEEVKDGLETVQEKKFKVPHPPVDAHQELLSGATANEEKRLIDAERLAAVKAKMDNTIQESDGLDSSAAGMTLKLPNMMELAELDVKWADETIAKNQADRIKLEVELKTYSNNMIKESIRMAHRDLGDFFRAVGDYGTSLKHYTKSREFCTTSQHVLDMCMSILELLIEHKNYAHLNTNVLKADAALDAATAANASATAPGGGTPVPTAVISSKKKSVERDNVQSKLDLATALSYLASASYEKAAISFLKISPPKDLGDWIGKTRHCIDIHLSPHVHDLTNLIRNCAVVLYFQPFATIKLERMGAAFGWTIEEVEYHVVNQSGDIQGRVDSQNKILQVKKTDHCAELFARAIKTGREMQAANRKLLLRMRLCAELIVKHPKGSGNQGSVIDFLQGAE
ncbi:hypothetical protein BYT27DRAFT_7262267 [Phlegmacium glaucopus]|nr:hypothetical protein BYT27DRAFT_7262267 [Phlegmacium glaucopus]